MVLIVSTTIRQYILDFNFREKVTQTQLLFSPALCHLTHKVVTKQ